MSEIYNFTQEDIKRLKYSPQVEYKYFRFDKGYVIKRIETTFVNDNFLEVIKKDRETKNNEENKIEID
ncbi:MAG: hypothetical protein PHU05_05050 [Bacilli bacterium]|nr:hypothetical protein [Bacilli bacterium]